MLTTCENCEKQKEQNERICPHCKEKFFPCRKCHTLLLIKKYRKIVVTGVHEGKSILTNAQGQPMVHHTKLTSYELVNIPCRHCGDGEPLKRFKDTYIGNILLSPIEPIVHLVSGLIAFIPVAIISMILTSIFYPMFHTHILLFVIIAVLIGFFLLALTQEKIYKNLMSRLPRKLKDAYGVGVPKSGSVVNQNGE